MEVIAGGGMAVFFDSLGGLLCFVSVTFLCAGHPLFKTAVLRGHWCEWVVVLCTEYKAVRPDHIFFLSHEVPWITKDLSADSVDHLAQTYTLLFINSLQDMLFPNKKDQRKMAEQLNYDSEVADEERSLGIVDLVTPKNAEDDIPDNLYVRELDKLAGVQQFLGFVLLRSVAGKHWNCKDSDVDEGNTDNGDYPQLPLSRQVYFYLLHLCRGIFLLQGWDDLQKIKLEGEGRGEGWDDADGGSIETFYLGLKGQVGLSVHIVVGPIFNVDAVDWEDYNHQDGVHDRSHDDVGQVLIVLVVRFLAHEKEVNYDKHKNWVVLPLRFPIVHVANPIVVLVIVHQKIKHLGQERRHSLDTIGGHDATSQSVVHPNQHDEASVLEEEVGDLLIGA